MRVAVLWPAMSGYMNACLKALSAQGDDVFLSYQPSASASAPFDEAEFGWLQDRHSWQDEPDARALRPLLRAFAPDVVLVSSWHIKGYRAQLGQYAGRAVRVLCMDNQWRGAPKQWLGRASSRWYLKPLYDVAFVPGERQAQYARMLGFSDDLIWRGLYTADTAPLAGGAHRQLSFVFVGRLVPDKAVDVLAEGYAAYRRSAVEPWPLHVHGTGPEHHRLDGQPGIEMKGFVQPADLPQVLLGATCLVLPSRFEPWGVAVHEAAAAGLVLVCSTRVGAAVHLLQDRWNGLLVPPEDPAALGQALAAVAAFPDDRLRSMSEGSRALAAQLSPETWARALRERVTQLASARR